jgi:hypothetical protein
MEENKKNAYRYLLYHFLLEIRTVPTPAQSRTESPTELTYHSYYAGAVAYQLHNLALAASTNFESFDEKLFWSGLKIFSINNPMIDLTHYHKVFDIRLAELGG